MKKILFLVLMFISSSTFCDASKYAAFFFFNCDNDVSVEDDFIKLEFSYYYVVDKKDEKKPLFMVRVKATNKLGQPIYVDTNNSFFYANNKVHCMYQDQTVDIGGIQLKKKRFVPIPPNSSAEIDEIDFKDVQGSESDWYIGLIGKHGLIEGASKQYSEEDSPMKVKAILTYSLSEDMADSKQIELSNYVETLVVDNFPKPVVIKEKQNGVTRWWTTKFNFKDCEYAQKYYNAFYFIDASYCLPVKTNVKKNDFIR